MTTRPQAHALRAAARAARGPLLALFAIELLTPRLLSAPLRASVDALGAAGAAVRSTGPAVYDVFAAFALHPTLAALLRVSLLNTVTVTLLVHVGFGALLLARGAARGVTWRDLVGTATQQLLGTIVLVLALTLVRDASESAPLWLRVLIVGAGAAFGMAWIETARASAVLGEHDRVTQTASPAHLRAALTAMRRHKLRAAGVAAVHAARWAVVAGVTLASLSRLDGDHAASQLAVAAVTTLAALRLPLLAAAMRQDTPERAS